MSRSTFILVFLTLGAATQLSCSRSPEAAEPKSEKAGELARAASASPSATVTETAHTGAARTDRSSGDSPRGATPPRSNLVVGSFNVEAGYKPDASRQYISEQVAGYSDVDVWGFSEVSSYEWPLSLKRAAESANPGRRYRYELGSASDDRLLIVYDDTRFDGSNKTELRHLRYGQGRAPLAIELSDSVTGTAFIFMVNHLHRGNAGKRHDQARGLHDWAQSQSVPVIAVGDYNFDWTLPDGTEHDRGFDLMTADGVFDWIKPDPLLETQCDSRYNSILDFVFVSGTAKEWTATSRVLEPEQAYCTDTRESSDHRPVLATFELTAVASPTPEPPQACDIKGNIGSRRRKVYHLPGCPSYSRTKIDESKGERMFCTEQQALEAGWEKAGNCK